MVLLGMLVGIVSSGSGLGGGFLVVPLLIFLGREAKMAVGTSFLFVLLVAVSALWAHFRLGNVDWKAGWLLAAGGVVGAQIGPWILHFLSEQHFKRGFSILLAGTAVWLFLSSRT